VLRELLNEESYICVGRAADFVLRDKPNVLTVYVDAPYDWRVEREMSAGHWQQPGQALY